MTSSNAHLVPYIREAYELEPESLPPHAAQLACRAFYTMRRTHQDQTIVLEGKSNSGKSATRHLLLSTLLNVGNTQPGKKYSKLTWCVPAAETLLDAFGNAGTAANSNASKYGSYSEMQYNDKSRLVGFKALTYHFDSKRVSGPAEGERNFHIFYYLVAGASKEEASHLMLDVSHQGGFSALNGTSFPVNVAADQEGYNKVKQGFRTLGFSKRIVSSILKVLAAILHLGQIDFKLDQSRSGEAAVVSNRNDLMLTASLLGVEAQELEAALQAKTKVFGWDRISRFLDPEAAAANRDELSRSLYGFLFTWMTDYINSKISKEDFKSFISVVDLPGMQATGGPRSHGLDDFCFNLAMERLHGFVDRNFFARTKPDYEHEGVTSLLPGLQAEHFDNEDCIRMLTAQPGGIVHIVDDQSKRKGKSASTMLEAIGKRWGNHSGFGWRAGDELYGRIGTFSINHFDGQVTYSVEDFVEANREAISTDFLTLFAGRASSETGDIIGGSNDSFVKELFERELKASQAIEQAAALEFKKRASTNRESSAPGGAPDIKTILAPLNESLSFLFEALSENRIWLLICFKPNEAGLPNHVDIRLMRNQLGAFGVVELARRLQQEWSVSLTHKEFWARYSKVELIKDTVAGLHTAIFSDKALGIREALHWSDLEMAIGRHKVMLSHSSFRYLEDHLRSQEPA